MLRGIIGTKDDYAALMLRLMLGIVFFVHGSQMVLGWFGGYGLVSALPGLAISRGSCLGLERGRQRLARSARDGGLGRQQNAAGRSQRGHRAADRGQTAACHLGSGGASPRPTGGAEACPTGRTAAISARHP